MTTIPRFQVSLQRILTVVGLIDTDEYLTAMQIAVVSHMVRQQVNLEQIKTLCNAMVDCNILKTKPDSNRYALANPMVVTPYIGQQKITSHGTRTLVAATYGMYDGVEGRNEVGGMWIYADTSPNVLEDLDNQLIDLARDCTTFSNAIAEIFLQINGRDMYKLDWDNFPPLAKLEYCRRAARFFRGNP